MQACECKLWDANIDHYNDMFNFVERYHGPSYEGEDYSFCPWCGTDIRGEDDEDNFDDEDKEEDDEEEEEEEEEESGDLEYELEFEPEIIIYPVMLDGWVSDN